MINNKKKMPQKMAKEVKAILKGFKPIEKIRTYGRVFVDKHNNQAVIKIPAKVKMRAGITNKTKITFVEIFTEEFKKRKLKIILR